MWPTVSLHGVGRRIVPSRSANATFATLQQNLFATSSFPRSTRSLTMKSRTLHSMPSKIQRSRKSTSSVSKIIVLSPRNSSSSAPATLPEEITFRPLVQVVQEQVAEGTLEADRAQARVAQRLGRLQQALAEYDNAILFQLEEQEEEEKRKQQRKVLEDATLEGDEIQQEEQLPEGPPPPPLRIPRGLYIHGSVGTGKTMLMDAFYKHCPSNKKSRFHFHAFLALIHQQIHHLKQEDLKNKGRSFSIDTSIENNPIYRVAKAFSQQTSVLCLDEFQVTDIADAVILSQLFSVLFRYGTVVVATSNRPPQDLYENGLNRSYFLPFLDLLQHHCIVHPIQSQQDYRIALASCNTFLGRAGNMDALLATVLQTLIVDPSPKLALDGSNNDNDEEEVFALEVIPYQTIALPVGFQRSLTIEKAYGDLDSKDTSTAGLCACRLDFAALCDGDYGAQDYRAIASTFDIVCLENVEVMNLEAHNRARRFITLIDELYEAKVCLLLTTAVSATNDERSDAFSALDLFETSSTATSSNEDLLEDMEAPTPTTKETSMGVDVAQEGGLAVGALASVRELSFAFERASSRIIEMSSKSWWDQQLPNGLP